MSMTARTIAADSAAETRYPITRHAGDDSLVAIRAGRSITRNTFLHDVASLAACLPAHGYILNLCTDRYRFAVGFAAALCRGQISLLPPGGAPGILAAVAADYPDLYALTDSAPPENLPHFAYPDQMDAPTAAVPLIPGAQQALVLFTSGSTGRPTPVPKSWGVLVNSALAAGARLGIAQGSATIIGTVPHQHSYGLESTILLALQHGLTLEAGGLFFPADIRAALETARRPRILVTTPVHLKTLVDEPGGMPPADIIVSATAPLTTALAAQAESCFGNATLVEIYGCTEAGQVATRRTVTQSEWRCLDGVTLTLRRGRMFATGPAVEGSAPLQDNIEPTTPGCFLLGGRPTDLVDVAGKRTSLSHLNHLLLSIDGVQDGVFFMTEPQSRAVPRLAALAVAPALRPQDIRAALRRLTDPAFLPRPLLLVDALPRNALGKLPREALLQAIARLGPP